MPVLTTEEFQRGHDIANWMTVGQDNYHRAFIDRVAGMLPLTEEDQAFFGTLPTTANRYLYKGKDETVPVFIAVDDRLEETRVMTE
jgi:hypothetical protein